MTDVLDGIRVLDFGRYIAGPYCAALLADMGADVIRIEKVDGSEDRFPAEVGPGTGALFLQVNRNKRGLTLNPTKPEGREIVKKLVATADVVVANLPPATLRQMGLDYESLTRSKPDIILTTVSAFGPGGPYSDKVGFDGIGQAMSGVMHLTGDADTPTKLYGPWVDFTTAISCAYGTLGALMARQKTGQGQIVQGALLRSALTISNSSVIEQVITNINRVGTGNRGQTAAPSDSFQTKDGWILVQVVGQPLFVRWAKLMGEDTWLQDPRFKDDDSRGIHGELVSERMARWCAERTSRECLDALEQARIPAGPIYTPQQAYEDPHVQATGYLHEIEFPGVPRPAPVADTPVSLSGTPIGVRHRAPTLSEHTETILGELGYDPTAIEGFRAARVV